MRLRRWHGLILRCALACGLIVIFVRLIDLRTVYASLDWSLLVGALLMQPLVIVGWLLAGWRHSVLIGKPRPPVILTTRAYVLSTGLNVLLPLRAGEVVKATYLRQHFGTRLRAGMSAVVLERILDVVVISAIGVAGLSAYVNSVSLWPISLALVIAAGGIVILSVNRPGYARKMARRLPRALSEPMLLIVAISRRVRSGDMRGGVALSFLAWGANLLAALVFLSVQDVVQPLPIGLKIAVFTATLFAGALPGLPGGVGAYQAAGAFILGQAGYGVEASVAVLIVMQASALVCAVIYAGVELVRGSTGVRSALDLVRDQFMRSKIAHQPVRDLAGAKPEVSAHGDVDARTIQDFGSQWVRYTDNQGYYASQKMFNDICEPLLSSEAISGKRCADLGSGTGRIVCMLLDAGASSVTAVEPSDAFNVLSRNVTTRKDDVRLVRARAHELPDGPYDVVFSIGVLHHIEDPAPAIQRAFDALDSGGTMLIWLYGVEGNESYLKIIQPLRQFTSYVPDAVLVPICHVLAGLLTVYAWASKHLPLPMAEYMKSVIGRYDWHHRFLTIFDQLNPAYAKYYSRCEAEALLSSVGFEAVRSHHRHNYSWTVIGTRPAVHDFQN